jgi:hypothetical protein
MLSNHVLKNNGVFGSLSTALHRRMMKLTEDATEALDVLLHEGLSGIARDIDLIVRPARDRSDIDILSSGETLNVFGLWYKLAHVKRAQASILYSIRNL